MARVLYITYDGLLDPLGGSQILPYVTAFGAWNEAVVILSFEKTQRLSSRECASLALRLKDIGIHWKPLRFTRRGGAIGKVWDLCRMYYWSIFLAFQHRVTAVHGRGHPASQVGLFLKRIYRSQLIFDLRGLWADERIDKGGWDMRKLMDRFQYGYYKRAERALLERADHVVVLTDAVVPELRKLARLETHRITVIPCCADFDLFQLTDPHRRTVARAEVNIPHNAIVVGYLGSAGRMYMLDRFFRFCELALRADVDAYALILTPDTAVVSDLIGRHLEPDLRLRVCLRSATRLEVAALIPAMDVLVSFIQPSYARLASSPTKLAECLAEGIPAICNAGVGDVADQLRSIDGGILVEPTSDMSLREAVAQLEHVRAKGGPRLRSEARKRFGLEVALERYRAVYAQIQREKHAERCHY